MEKIKKNNFLVTFLLILVFISVLCFSGCENVNTVSITSIKKTSSNGLVDVYTITYSNGTTSDFTITNGKDGEEGSTLSINDIYNTLVSKGYTGSFDDFLKEYLSYEEKTSNTTQAINSAILSSVSVYSQFKEITIEPVYSTDGYFIYQTGTKEVKSTSVGAGSGIIYSLDKENGNAYLITNYHVVYNSKAVETIGEIRVFLYGSSVSVYKETDSNGDAIVDSEGYQKVHYSSDAILCEYVGGSLTYDIAVLKINNSEILKNSSAKAVDIAESYSVGDTAIAIGNPEALGTSVTKGIVSVESEYISMTAADNSTKVKFRTIRIDTAINSGNSGGGLFNEEGKLIGIVNAKIVSSSIENIAYAIPRDIVLNVANNLIYNYEKNATKKVYKITIGLTLKIDSSTAIYDEETKLTKIVEKVIVDSVTENSLANSSSVNFMTNDEIKSISINGKDYEIERMFNAIDLALNIKVGDSVTYKIVRKGEVSVISFIANSEYFSFVE